MSDNTTHQLPELTDRQEHILSLIVQTYTQVPEPVSSNQLVRDHNLSVSSATVRNEMAHLEELGYITAPHTSAGRVPTANGYRYIVRALTRGTDTSLSPVEQQYISNRFNELPAVLDQWLKQAATALARTADMASLVTVPMAETSRFKHVELISIQGRLALMVLVVNGGALHQRMLNLAEAIPQAALSEAANRLNSLCADLTPNQLRLKARQFDVFESEVIDLAADLMESAQRGTVRYVYRDGLSEIIKSFPDSEGAQQALRIFEERGMLDMILTELLQPLMNDDHVRVIIAGDGRYDELSRLSIVISRYGMPQMGGALGLVGPTHLNYGRAISAVRYVSGLMTDMIVNLYDTSATSDSETASGDAE